jgi:3-deoxy-D-manno-octulosonic acid (KDO) 8-phosphate synthase
MPGIGTIHGFRASSQASAICTVLQLEAKLGRNHDLIKERNKGFTQQLFIGVRTVPVAIS